MATYAIQPLGPETWDAYARLIERHNGVWGGCSRLAFHRKAYEAGLVESPDYRITCFFVDRDHRREGVAAVALRGAMRLIAEAGGGVVEGYPQDTQGKKVSASFLYNGTRGLFERIGFAYERPKGKNHCVMRTTIAPNRP
jgi:GNAT superfamily N-acetyltransferase